MASMMQMRTRQADAFIASRWAKMCAAGLAPIVPSGASGQWLFVTGVSLCTIKSYVDAAGRESGL